MPHSLVLIDVKFDTASSLIKVHKHKFFSLLLVLSHPDSNRRLSLHVLFKYLKNIVYAGTDSCYKQASLWLDSQPTSFRVFHFCTRGCHGYQSSSSSDKERQCRHTENKPGQTTTRQEAEIEPEHLNLEMEATDWNSERKCTSEAPFETLKHTDGTLYLCLSVCLFLKQISQWTHRRSSHKVVCHVYMLL